MPTAASTGNSDESNGNTAFSKASTSRGVVETRYHHLVLLSLLDATLPVLYSVRCPYSISDMCVEPRSGRVFATRSGGVQDICPVTSSMGGGGMLRPGNGDPATGTGGRGVISVLALASGHFLDRGAFRCVQHGKLAAEVASVPRVNDHTSV